MPARINLLPLGRGRPTVISEPAVIKRSSRVAVGSGEGCDGPAPHCAYRYEAMPAWRERYLTPPLPCLACRAAGLKQVQRPGVRSRRNRYTPEYHAIGGFIKASPCA